MIKRYPKTFPTSRCFYAFFYRKALGGAKNRICTTCRYFKSRESTTKLGGRCLRTPYFYCLPLIHLDMLLFHLPSSCKVFSVVYYRVSINPTTCSRYVYFFVFAERSTLAKIRASPAVIPVHDLALNVSVAFFSRRSYAHRTRRCLKLRDTVVMVDLDITTSFLHPHTPYLP